MLFIDENPSYSLILGAYWILLELLFYLGDCIRIIGGHAIELPNEVNLFVVLNGDLRGRTRRGSVMGFSGDWRCVFGVELL